MALCVGGGVGRKTHRGWAVRPSVAGPRTSNLCENQLVNADEAPRDASLTSAQAEIGSLPKPTAEERERGLAALESARRFSERLLRERGGVPFPNGWELLHVSREERDRQLYEALTGTELGDDDV